MQEGKGEGNTEKEKDHSSATMIHLNFSRRFSELQKDEHVIKIREVIRFTKKSNKAIEEEITKYKESNKEVKIKVRRKYFLNTYLILKTF